MTRWMMGAVLTAALLYPLQASAQRTDNAKLKCDIGAKGSIATIENTNKAKKSSMCRWSCVYRTYPGPAHINKGARKMNSGETRTFKKTGINIAYLVDIKYDCP